MSKTESTQNQSFAARFASKKTNFTSQSLSTKAAETQNTDPSKNSTASPDSNSNSSAPFDPSKMAASSKLKKPVDPIKKMQAEQIYLVKGVDAGRNAWYYVLVERLKVQVFLKALNDDIIHLENYGRILYSAYGDEPPVEITDMLKEEYGIQ
jgi:hypothetical protein